MQPPAVLWSGTCDWPALAKLSGRIQRHIRRHLATAKLWGRPILHQAFTVVQQGHGLFYSGTVHRADSKDIQNVAAGRTGRRAPENLAAVSQDHGR